MNNKIIDGVLGKNKPGLEMLKDYDKDGVANVYDCQPYRKRKWRFKS